MSTLLACRSSARSVHPTLRHGRAPSGPGEVVVGPVTLKRMHRQVGDHVTVNGASGPVDVTIVGEAVFPMLGNNSWGDTMSMTEDTLRRIGAPVLASGYLIDLAPSADLAALRRSVPDLDVHTPFSPAPIIHVHAVTGIVNSLVGFFGFSPWSFSDTEQ